MNPENATWWASDVNEILKTKREWTYSLIAQMITVTIAQGFSILDYITVNANDNIINVGLAINSVSIWMIPVGFGWVKVGPQTSVGSIKAALRSIPVPLPVTRQGKRISMRSNCISIREPQLTDQSGKPGGGFF